MDFVILGPRTIMTPLGGFATLLKNETRSVVLPGTICACNPYVDNAVVPCTLGMESLGVALQEIKAGADGWVVTSGMAEVLVMDGVKIERASRAVVGKNGMARMARRRDGRKRLLGVFMEEKEEGKGRLAKVLLHF